MKMHSVISSQLLHVSSGSGLKFSCEHSVTGANPCQNHMHWQGTQCPRTELQLRVHLNLNGSVHHAQRKDALVQASALDVLPRAQVEAPYQRKLQNSI